MPTFEWDDDTLLLIEKADQQSQYLIELLDKAYEETARGAAIENFTMLTDGLTDYATAHLDFVELMSTRTHLLDKRKEHKAFTDSVEELKNAHYCACRHVPLKALSYLINWLSYHKPSVDMAIFK